MRIILIMINKIQIMNNKKIIIIIKIIITIIMMKQKSMKIIIFHQIKIKLKIKIITNLKNQDLIMEIQKIIKMKIIIIIKKIIIKKLKNKNHMMTQMIYQIFDKNFLI